MNKSLSILGCLGLAACVASTESSTDNISEEQYAATIPASATVCQVPSTAYGTVQKALSKGCKSIKLTGTNSGAVTVSTNVTISGGSFTNAANGDILTVTNTGNLTLKGSTISHGNYTGSAISNSGTISLEESYITNKNDSITILNNGTVTMTGGAVAGNGSGVGIESHGELFLSNTRIDWFDYGVYSDLSWLEVSDTTIADITVNAIVFDSPYDYALLERMTIYDCGDVGVDLLAGTVVMTNATITGCHSPLDVHYSAEYAFLNSVTFSGNETMDAGAPVYVWNSIIDEPAGCSEFESWGHNLFGEACHWPTETETDTVGESDLGPLQDNGGSTLTMMPNAYSPVVDAGDTSATTDQRGVSRPRNGADDIGAVER